MKHYKDLVSEISRKTLGSYIRKATDDVDDTSFAAGDKFAKRGNIDKLDAHVQKRKKGIATATHKLTKDDLDQYSFDDLLEFIQTEEYSQLDELSKKTLGSYIKKASSNAVTSRGLSKDFNHNADHNVDGNPEGNRTAANMFNKKANKRLQGISKATDKLTKESVDELSEYGFDELLEFLVSEEYNQLDELSKQTLGKYIKRAATDLDAKSFTSGHQFGLGYKNAGASAEERAYRRKKGIHKATDKITKEDLDQYELGDLIEFIETEEYSQLDELSKKTLGSYIKKASHDVATKSAAVARYAERQHAAEKDQDYTIAKKNKDISDKAFEKSWNRRTNMAKAIDKITKEDVDAILESILVEGEDRASQLHKDTIKSIENMRLHSRNGDHATASYHRANAEHSAKEYHRITGKPVVHPDFHHGNIKHVTNAEPHVPAKDTGKTTEASGEMKSKIDDYVKARKGGNKIWTDIKHGHAHSAAKAHHERTGKKVYHPDYEGDSPHITNKKED